MTESTPSTVVIAAESLATMERETQALFDAASQARTTGASQAAAGRSSPATSAAPASDAGNAATSPGDRQVSRSSASATAPTTASSSTGASLNAPPATSTSKVSGPPAGAPNAVAGQVGGGVEAKASPTANSDFSDVPAADGWEKKEVKADHWKRLHAKASASEMRAAAAERELTGLRTRAAAPATADPVVQQQLTALAAERDTYRARLEAVAVEKSPRFEQQFKPRQEAAIMTAKDAVGPTLAPQIEALLLMEKSTFRDAQIAEIAERLPLMERDELLASARELNRLRIERNQMAQHGTELYKTWTAEEQQQRTQAQAQRTAQANNVFESELVTWKAAIAIPDDDLATARAIYSGQGVDLKDAANASLWAVVGPQIARTANSLQTRNAELEAQLARYKSVQPSHAADTSSTGATSDDSDDPSTMGFGERVAKLAAENGLLRR